MADIHPNRLIAIIQFYGGGITLWQIYASDRKAKRLAQTLFVPSLCSENQDADMRHQKSELVEVVYENGNQLAAAVGVGRLGDAIPVLSKGDSSSGTELGQRWHS